jgi:bifunctional non-homologous end joining protein LigD
MELPAGADIPRNVRPVVCKLVREPFTRRGWIFEIEWDGFRTIAKIDASGVKLYSRTQNSFTKKFAEIAKVLAALGHRAVLDGEVVALDEEGHSRFEWLFRRNGNRSKGRLIYYVFDLLYLDGEDLRGLPLHRRKARITVKLIPRSATP